MKNVILVHGIGDSQPDFYKEYEAILKQNHDGSGFTVQGLYWEDVLSKMQEKYPVIHSNFNSFLSLFGLDRLSKEMDTDQYKKIEDYVMDVLTFVCLPDMTRYILAECLKKLDKLAAGKEKDTIIISHSLGSAMIPFILWDLRQHTAAIPYNALILLASPLGYCSPVNSALSDFLYLMGRNGDLSRTRILRGFAREFTLKGPGHLHFINNTNDIVCSDVQFKITDSTYLDAIPVRQGFNDEEIDTLEKASPGCFHKFTFGKPDFKNIASNHDFAMYLKQDCFNDAFAKLLS